MRKKLIQKLFKSLSIFVITFLFIGCNALVNKNFDKQEIKYPKSWDDGTDLSSVENNWIKNINIPNVVTLVEDAIKNNYKLKQLAYDVKIQRQQIIKTHSYVLPSADLLVSQQSKRTTDSSNTVYTSGLELNVKYEVDIWGKLSDAEKKVNLDLMSALAIYEQEKQQLAADVMFSWLQIVESQKQIDLFNKRIKNINENKKIIEFSYKSGLNSATDVYLIRNELYNEISKLENQTKIYKQAVRELELLLGKYPKGNMFVNGDIPELSTEVKMGLPSELINRKPELVASWNKLLSRDANLAFTHKQRLPSLNLSTSLDYSAKRANDLISGVPLVWSVLGSLSAPIFDAKRLKSNEEIALLELKKEENKYLETVYRAYVNVENAHTNENSLKKQYEATKKAEQNAKYSRDILLDKYFSGLVNYTDVLEVQNRLYDLQSRIIQLKKELIINRVELHLSLGGDFDSKEKNQKGNL